jgi:hypothetical protein
MFFHCNQWSQLSPSTTISCVTEGGENSFSASNIVRKWGYNQFIPNNFLFTILNSYLIQCLPFYTDVSKAYKYCCSLGYIAAWIWMWLISEVKENWLKLKTFRLILFHIYASREFAFSRYQKSYHSLLKYYYFFLVEVNSSHSLFWKYLWCNTKLDAIFHCRIWLSSDQGLMMEAVSTSEILVNIY